MSGNQALNVNNVVGPQADLAITTRGSDWYFTVCAMMGAATVAVVVHGLLRRPQDRRVFHYLTAGTTAVACVAYFSMGAGLGQVPIRAEFARPWRAQVAAAGTREIFYARYVDWVVTTPLLLLDLLLTSGAPAPATLAVLLANELMVVAGLVVALTRTSYKWGYWAFGMAAFLFIAHALLRDGRARAARLGAAPRACFDACALWLLLVWTLYPVVWGLGEGGNVIHPDSEAVFYGILDFLAKPVFGALLLFMHRNINPADLGHRYHRSDVAGAGAATATAAGAGTAAHPFDSSHQQKEKEKEKDDVSPGTSAIAANRNDVVHPEGPGPNVASNPTATGGYSGQSTV